MTENCKDCQRKDAALRAISALNPEIDSSEGFNEWGEADCFNKSQSIARSALAPAAPEPERRPLSVHAGPLSEAKRAITVLLAFHDIHEDEKRGLRKAAYLLGIDCEPAPEEQDGEE